MDIDLAEPTRPQLAALLGCSTRWIGELRAAGDLPADGSTWAENLEAWIELKDAGSSGATLEAERARLVREQADAKAMDNAERRRELASLPGMTMAVTGMISLAVSRLMQVAALVARGDHKLRERIETALSDALEELSVTRVEEATGGIDEEEASGEEGG